jgi:hypothetical protein
LQLPPDMEEHLHGPDSESTGPAEAGLKREEKKKALVQLCRPTVDGGAGGDRMLKRPRPAAEKEPARASAASESEQVHGSRPPSFASPLDLDAPAVEHYCSVKGVLPLQLSTAPFEGIGMQGPLGCPETNWPAAMRIATYQRWGWLRHAGATDQIHVRYPFCEPHSD